jgi:hypothetical protein
MKRAIGLLTLTLSSLPVLARAAATPAKADEPKVMVFRPEDGATYRKAGLQTEVAPAAARAQTAVSPPSAPEKGPDLAEWPDYNRRMGLLRKLPELAKAAKKNKWDDFELDKFIYRASRKDANVAALREIYPQLSEGLIRSTLKAAK